MDVDGVLTDGRITYTSAGEELKSFNIKDGLGIKLLQREGIQVAIITGRNSPMVERRAEELGIDHIVQGREDKYQALCELSESTKIALDQMAYMGDDLPDLTAVMQAGLGITVADGHASLRDVATLVTRLPGGAGAVREACEWLLNQRGALNSIIRSYESQE